MDKILSSIYYNPRSPASFSGATKLYREARRRIDLTLADVREWLSRQDVYSKHKPLRTNYPRLASIPIGLGTTIYADLIDFVKLKRKNSHYSYVLCVVELLSRRAYSENLKTKTGAEVLRAFQSIYKRLPTRPMRCITDSGREFLNSQFQTFCKRERLTHIVATRVNHAYVCERFIRTIKQKLYKYFTNSNTTRWVDVFPTLVESYNNTEHSSIQAKPNDVTLRNEEQYIARMIRRARGLKRKPKYKVGQTVRVAQTRKSFHKGYRQSYSDEVFVIRRLDKRPGPPAYRISHLDGKQVEGLVYEPEITAASITGERQRRGKYEFKTARKSTKS